MRTTTRRFCFAPGQFPRAFVVSAFVVILPACCLAGAPSLVLYETGWEPTPASPAWARGNLIPQNSWLSYPEASNDRNKIIANGTSDANPFGSPVTTPSGSQFHRFRASSSTSDMNEQYVWPDL